MVYCIHDNLCINQSPTATFKKSGHYGKVVLIYTGIVQTKLTILQITVMEEVIISILINMKKYKGWSKTDVYNAKYCLNICQKAIKFLHYHPLNKL